jgi:hypothetical protein
MPKFRFGSFESRSKGYSTTRPDLPFVVADFLDHGAEEGSRNRTLHSVAAQMRDVGASMEETMGLLHDKALSIGLGEHEIAATIQSAYRGAVRPPPARPGSPAATGGTIVRGAFGGRPVHPVGLPPVRLTTEDGVKGEANYILTEDPLPEPIPNPTVEYLKAMFRAGERIQLVRADIAEDGKEGPCPKTTLQAALTLEAWLAKLDKTGGDCKKAIYPASEPHGCYVCINPLKGTRRVTGEITKFRHALIEFDDLPRNHQWQLIQQSKIPCTAVVDSGGKSIHALVRVDAPDLDTYKQRVQMLMDHFAAYGVDPQNCDPTRLSRLPGPVRGDTGEPQRLLSLAMGFPTFEEWQCAAIADHELPPEMPIEDLEKFVADKDPNNVIGKRWLCKGGTLLIQGQCLHPDTMIFDPMAGVSRKVSEITEEWHVAAMAEDGEIVVSRASVPTKIGRGRMLKITLQGGRELRVAEGHLLWDGERYVSASDLCSRVVDGVRLPSISDDDLLALSQGAQHWMQTGEGCRDSCRSLFHSCDQPPQLAGVASRSLIPLRGDARAHSPFDQLLGAPSEALGYIHDQTFGLPSSSHSFHDELIVVGAECQAPGGRLIPTAETTLSLLLQPPRYAQRGTTQPLASCAQGSMFGVGFLCSSVLLYQSASVESIEEDGESDYWDFSVPIFNNYVSESIVSHNSGVGKSSLLQQMAISWTLGKDFFGIQPIKPLRALIIQAENDLGDLAEAYQGISSGMDLSAEERTMLRGNMVFVRDTIHTGEHFVHVATRLIAKHKPDIVFVDPLLSFIGGDISDQETASTFLRNQLGPVLMQSQVIWVWLHHTGKPPSDPRSRDGWSEKDMAYMGLGSSELANWAREVAVLQKLSKDADIYGFTLCKRGNRSGMLDEMGEATHTINLQHAKGRICWERADTGEMEVIRAAAEEAKEGMRKGGRRATVFTPAQKKKVLQWVHRNPDQSMTGVLKAAGNILKCSERKAREWLNNELFPLGLFEIQERGEGRAKSVKLTAIGALEATGEEIPDGTPEEMSEEEELTPEAE